MEPAALILIISEIMYNPQSVERPPAQTEWVEIYNPGDQPVSLAGWYLADEDGQTQPIPAEVSIAPGEAVVLVPFEQEVREFQNAWGEDFQVVPVEGWNGSGMRGLANAPDEDNEILTLRRPDGSAADTVNYDDSDPWPRDSPDGASIYLAPGHVAAGQGGSGQSWRRSEAEVHGARSAQETTDYSAQDTGSPGTVVLEEGPQETP